MTSSLLVTGGTGTLGSHAVRLLQDRGVPLRVLSRSPREDSDGVEHVVGDLVRGTGIDEAVDGVTTVLHLAGGPKDDETAADTLVAAAQRSGVKHLVHISVVGVDRVPVGWFRSQQVAERTVRESGIPWTVLRAAQFHDLTLRVAGSMARLPLTPSPGGLRFEPVDARDVAERLVDLALGEPAGLVPDLAGPRVYPMVDLVRSVRAARGKGRRPALPVRIPGAAGRAYRAGDNLAGDGADRGQRTWEDFLAEHVGARPQR